MYWSTVNPKKRCVYTCRTEEVDFPKRTAGKFSAEKDVFGEQVVKEHTVTCHEDNLDNCELSNSSAEHKKKWRLVNSTIEPSNSIKRNDFTTGNIKVALQRPSLPIVHLNKPSSTSPRNDNSELKKLLHGSSPNIGQTNGVTEKKDTQKELLRMPSQTKNTHDVSAMDVLVNLTKEKSRLSGTSASLQPSLASQVSQMPTKKSACDSVTRQSKMYSEIFPKTSPVRDPPSFSLSSRATANQIKSSRINPVPLAPKPVPCVAKSVQLNPKPIHLNPKHVPLAPKPTHPPLKSDVLPANPCHLRFSPTPSSTNTAVHFTTTNSQQNSQHIPQQTLPQTSQQTCQQTSEQNCQQNSQRNSQQNFQRNSQQNSKSSVDSGNLAVVVGSPEQITKLLAENPSMIQLLGSKSSAYLGELLASSTSTKLQGSWLMDTEKNIKSLASQNKCMNPFPNFRNMNSGMPRPLPNVKRNNPKVKQTNVDTAPTVIDLTKDDTKYNENTGRKSTQRSNIFSFTKMNKPKSIPSSRKVVRKLDRRCLNENRKSTTSSLEQVKSQKKVDIIDLDDTMVTKPRPFLGTSSSLPVTPQGFHTKVNAKMNHQYIFNNRRFMHASLDKPVLDKEAKKVSPLSSPAKMIENVESQSVNLKPIIASSFCQNFANSEKPDGPELKDDELRTFDDGNVQDTDLVSKKESLKAGNKKYGSSVKESKRKHLNICSANDKKCRGKNTKKKDHLKRKIDNDNERPLKKAKVDEDHIALPDFERARQSDNKNKRLEKVDEESSVLFTITSDEGFEVQARTCEGSVERAKVQTVEKLPKIRDRRTEVHLSLRRGAFARNASPTNF